MIGTALSLALAGAFQLRPAALPADCPSAIISSPGSPQSHRDRFPAGRLPDLLHLVADPVAPGPNGTAPGAGMPSQPATPDQADISAIIDRSTAVKQQLYSAGQAADGTSLSQPSTPAQQDAAAAGAALGQALQANESTSFQSAVSGMGTDPSEPANQSTALAALHVAAVGNMNDPNNRQSVEEYADHTLMSQQEQAALTLVFISTSMPDTQLQAMFGAVSADPTLLQSTVFIFRGWPDEPQGMAELVQHIHRLMPAHSAEPNVEVNPTLFTDYKIPAAPYLEHRVRTGQGATRWVAVPGATNIPSTIEALDKGETVPPGQTQPIAEPDMIQTITAHMKSYDWEHAVEEAKEQSWDQMAARLAISLPIVHTGLSYQVDPSILVTSTITLPDGKVLARPGDRINPLTQYPFAWPQVYAVFDATSPWQVAQARAWQAKYGAKLVLMSNHLPLDFLTWVHLTQSFGTPVSALTQSIADRLGIRAVPALAIPAGSVFDVTVIPEPAAAAIAKAAGYQP